jgi:twitching motility protein PilT
LQPAPFTPSPTAAFELSAPPPSPFALPQSAVVLPLARNPIRSEVPLPLAEQELAGLDRLLRLAAARGASTLYLSSASRPSVRVDGEVQTLDGAPVLGPNDVESLLLTLMPERNAEALRTGGASEWICDLPDVGRVRCMSFRDHRGPGGVFRMMPVRAVTVEQLGLSREIQALAIEPEGLVLVAGPRSSGKRTLLSALVDLVNRVRHDHVITIEKEINVVHERNGSFISQREVHGGSDELLAVVRAALRENPDVLVLEELRSAAVMDVALDAASSGQLVIGGLPAPNATGAIDRIIDLYAPECRRQVQLSLAQNLRGVVSQVLLRKTGGGRLAAREVLINTPAVRSILAEGKTSQLPLAIEGGRAHGMVPLNDWLVGYVQSGAVDVREAYRRAVDRAGFLALLKRQGLDTSAIERFA